MFITHSRPDHFPIKCLIFSNKVLVSSAQFTSITLMMVVFFLVLPLYYSSLVTMRNFLCLYRIFFRWLWKASSSNLANCPAGMPRRAYPASSQALTQMESVQSATLRLRTYRYWAWEYSCPQLLHLESSQSVTFFLHLGQPMQQDFPCFMEVRKQTAYDHVPAGLTQSIAEFSQWRVLMPVFRVFLLESGLTKEMEDISLIYFLRGCCLRTVMRLLNRREYWRFPWYSLTWMPLIMQGQHQNWRLQSSFHRVISAQTLSTGSQRMINFFLNGLPSLLARDYTSPSSLTRQITLTSSPTGISVNFLTLMQKSSRQGMEGSSSFRAMMVRSLMVIFNLCTPRQLLSPMQPFEIQQSWSSFNEPSKRWEASPYTVHSIVPDLSPISKASRVDSVPFLVTQFLRGFREMILPRMAQFSMPTWRDLIQLYWFWGLRCRPTESVPRCCLSFGGGRRSIGPALGLNSREVDFFYYLAGGFERALDCWAGGAGGAGGAGRLVLLLGLEFQPQLESLV